MSARDAIEGSEGRSVADDVAEAKLESAGGPPAAQTDDSATGPAPLISSLQAFDLSRTRELKQSYSQCGAAEVHLRVSESPSTFTSRVHLAVTLPAGCDRVELFYPTSMEGPRVKARTPVVYTDLQFDATDDPNQRAVASPELTTVHVGAATGRSHVSMVLDGAYTKRVSDQLFETWQLGLGIRIPGAPSVLLRLDHPSDIGLRARIDNSEYHSLAEGVGVSTVRKTSFFASEHAFLLYVYGTSDTSSSQALSRIPFAGAFGLVSAGLMVAFDLAGRDDLAATALAFAMIPPLAQVVNPARTAYNSADIRQDGTIRRWLLALGGLYLLPAAIAVWSISDMTALRSFALALCYAVGALFALLGIGVLWGVDQQFIPYHYCDGCAKRIHWRRRSTLDQGSRRTLCKTCSRTGVPGCGWIE